MQVARNHSGTLLCGLLYYVGYITKALHGHLPDVICYKQTDTHEVRNPVLDDSGLSDLDLESPHKG